MSVRVVRDGAKTVIELNGRMAAGLPLELERELLESIGAGCHLDLDLSNWGEVTPGGLRTLLLLYRRIVNVGGVVTIVGASPETVETLDAIGFLHLTKKDPSRRRGVEGVGPSRLDVYPTHRHEIYSLAQGFPLQFGAMFLPGSQCVNFSVYSRHAESCSLVLFEKGTQAPLVEIPFPPEFRVGHVFTMIVFGLDPDRTEYAFRMYGPFAPAEGHRFDPTKTLVDPYARALCGRDVWGVAPRGGAPLSLRSRFVHDDFDWEDDRHPAIATEDLVIYEMHVRGFTRHASSGATHPGTFAGLRSKIPYLKELGVNCVELMPIFEFDEFENDRINPETGQRLMNYWGYSTVGFFAPKAGYAATGRLGMQSDELKALVKELHRNGIEIILDVVFNHTAEGNENGPTISFRGIDNKTYYMLGPDGSYLNFSGCGNTFNCNHPVVRDMVVNCLRYWVAHYHIDGFRFDLASILGRDVNGQPLSNPPLLEALAHDPILAHCKLIAEAWDAAGLYQVGNFPSYGRWAEWNGRYRDCVRRFIKGDPGQIWELSQRLMGSPDLYPDRGPAASVNFVTCHDGFTLWDLVSYNTKRNESNGENNQDGADENDSWNCGVEGPTDDPAVLELRRRQVKNALTILMCSQGVPMLLMGDECGRTQRGNNNAYCHDGPLTWLDWNLLETNQELHRFCRELIAFRKRHKTLRFPLHPGNGAARPELEVTWHGTVAHQPDWSYDSHTLAFMRHCSRSNDDPFDCLYIAMNMHDRTHSFGLPDPPAGAAWRVAVNTGLEPPHDIYEAGSEPPLQDSRYCLVRSHAVIVLVARPDAR